MMASVLPLEYESQIKLLEEVNVEKRALMIKEHLMRMVQVFLFLFVFFKS